MSNSDGSQDHTELRRKRLLKSFRMRVMLLALVVNVVSFVLVAAVLFFTGKNGSADLIGALSRAVSSFSVYCTQDYLSLTRHANNFLADEKLDRLLNSGKDIDKIFAEADKSSLEELKNGLLVDMAGLNDDILLLTDKDGNICFNVVRIPSSDPNVDGGAAEVSFEQNKNENLADAYSIEDGSSVDSVLFEPMLKSDRPCSGFMRFNADGPIYTAVGIMLDKKRKDFGFMIVGRRVSENSLSAWGQGMPIDVLLFTTSEKVLMGYDNRSASRPTPVLASELEKLLADWNPHLAASKLEPSGNTRVNPDELQFVGKKWYAVSSEIFSAGKHELLGYVVFLVDTDSLNKEMKQLLWILGFCFAINLLLTGGLFYLYAPKNLRFILKEAEKAEQS